MASEAKNSYQEPELIDQFIYAYININTERVERSSSDSYLRTIEYYYVNEDHYRFKDKDEISKANTLLYNQINNLPDFEKFFYNYKIAEALKYISWDSPEFRSLPKRFITEYVLKTGTKYTSFLKIVKELDQSDEVKDALRNTLTTNDYFKKHANVFDSRYKGVREFILCLKLMVDYNMTDIMDQWIDEYPGSFNIKTLEFKQDDVSFIDFIRPYLSTNNVLQKIFNIYTNQSIHKFIENECSGILTISRITNNSVTLNYRTLVDYQNMIDAMCTKFKTTKYTMNKTADSVVITWTHI